MRIILKVKVEKLCAKNMYCLIAWEGLIYLVSARPGVPGKSLGEIGRGRVRAYNS